VIRFTALLLYPGKRAPVPREKEAVEWAPWVIIFIQKKQISMDVIFTLFSAS
jgi:hypothetical protein